MPVQTRKKREAKSVKPTAKVEEKTKSPAKRTTKKSKTESSVEVNEGIKGQFNQVLQEVVQTGSKVLTKHIPYVEQKQDQSKARKRKRIAEEVRKHSLTSDLINPVQVKESVHLQKKKKTEEAKTHQKSIVSEIKGLGEEGVQKLLHNIAPTSQVNRTKQKVTAPVSQIKTWQKKTIQELTDLVTPTVEHKPSIVKERLNSIEKKKILGLEAVKYVTVKEIQNLGENGVKNLVKSGNKDEKIEDVKQEKKKLKGKAKQAKK